MKSYLWNLKHFLPEKNVTKLRHSLARSHVQNQLESFQMKREEIGKQSGKRESVCMRERQRVRKREWRIQT